MQGVDRRASRVGVRGAIWSLNAITEGVSAGRAVTVSVVRDTTGPVSGPSEGQSDHTFVHGVTALFPIFGPASASNDC
jgi:hypothetical protein